MNTLAYTQPYSVQLYLGSSIVVRIVFGPRPGGDDVTRLVIDRAAYPKLGDGSHTPRHYDLLKLDGDGPEGGWMSAIERLITRGLITVGAITLEGNNLYPSHMQVS